MATAYRLVRSLAPGWCAMTRFLRCPRCRAVRLAESYPPAGAYCAGWDAGSPARRVCPCGYEGPAAAFRTVRGSHPGAPPTRPLQLMLPAAPRRDRGSEVTP
jgi:hypothetical protein